MIRIFVQIDLLLNRRYSDIVRRYLQWHLPFSKVADLLKSRIPKWIKCETITKRGVYLFSIIIISAWSNLDEFVQSATFSIIATGVFLADVRLIGDVVRKVDNISTASQIILREHNDRFEMYWMLLGCAVNVSPFDVCNLHGDFHFVARAVDVVECSERSFDVGQTEWVLVARLYPDVLVRPSGGQSEHHHDEYTDRNKVQCWTDHSSHGKLPHSADHTGTAAEIDGYVWPRDNDASGHLSRTRISSLAWPGLVPQTSFIYQQLAQLPTVWFIATQTLFGLVLTTTSSQDREREE